MPAGDPRGLKWLTIDDFSPGLYTATGFSAKAGNQAPQPAKVPGMASGATGCMVGPTGALMPGPGILTTSPWGGSLPITSVHTARNGVNTDLCTGLFLSGPLRYYGANPYPQTQGDELIVGQARIDGANITHWIDSLQITPSTYNVNNIVTAGPSTQRLPFGTMTAALTRANQGPTLVGLPLWTISHWFTGGSAGEPFPGTPYDFLYPDPTASGLTFGIHTMLNAVANTLAHQNRIIYLTQELINYTSSSTFAGGNEAFNYTDPPNGIAIPGQLAIFVQEDPSGYGAWGSQSASELFLVKNYGGGVLITGDLNSPDVIRLPGVTPAYGLMSKAASTPIGLVYASNNRGLWAWNGGNTSIKISEQLEDNFFVNNLLPPIVDGPTVDICRWGDWIIATNDYLYDTQTQSWWNMVDSIWGRHQWYAVSSDGRYLYAALATIPGGNNVGPGAIIEIYDRQTPSSSWTWSSLPIKIPTGEMFREAAIREVVVKASGAGQITVGLVGRNHLLTTDSPSSTATFTSTSQTQTIRVAIGARTVAGPLIAEDITLILSAQATTPGTPAPTVHAVSIGFEDSSTLVSAT